MKTTQGALRILSITDATATAALTAAVTAAVTDAAAVLLLYVTATATATSVPAKWVTDIIHTIPIIRIIPSFQLLLLFSLLLIFPLFHYRYSGNAVQQVKLTTTQCISSRTFRMLRTLLQRWLGTFPVPTG